MSKTESNSDQVANDRFCNVKSAKGGNKTAIAGLRKELAGPNAIAILGCCGDLAFQAEESLLVAMLGVQEGNKTCVREKLKRMRIELVGTIGAHCFRSRIRRRTISSSSVTPNFSAHSSR